MAARAQPVTSPLTCIEGEEERWWMRKRGALSSTRLVRRRGYIPTDYAFQTHTGIYGWRASPQIYYDSRTGGWVVVVSHDKFLRRSSTAYISPPSLPSLLLLVALSSSCRLFCRGYVRFSRNGLTRWTNSGIHSTGVDPVPSRWPSDEYSIINIGRMKIWTWIPCVHQRIYI